MLLSNGLYTLENIILVNMISYEGICTNTVLLSRLSFSPNINILLFNISNKGGKYCNRLRRNDRRAQELAALEEYNISDVDDNIIK